MRRLRFRPWTLRPTVRAFAQAPEDSVAPRDGGWVELWDVEADRRFGRGNLKLWPAEPGAEWGTTNSDSPGAGGGEHVDKDAAQPVGESGPSLRAELSSFTFDGPPPQVGEKLMIRPETGLQDYYLVRVVEVEVEAADSTSGHVTLDWRSERLPASLSELGGH